MRLDIALLISVVSSSYNQILRNFFEFCIITTANTLLILANQNLSLHPLLRNIFRLQTQHILHPCLPELACPTFIRVIRWLSNIEIEPPSCKVIL